MLLTGLIFVIIIAIIFEYINGFHDSANAIATVVSTKVLSARHAIIFAAMLNFLGAFAGTHVAKTIGAGIVATNSVSQLVIVCALLGAIIWNLFTWYFGIPSSSSHALIGGLIGASVASSGWKVILFTSVFTKIILPMFLSPLIGFVVGSFCMIILLWMFKRSNPMTVTNYFKKLQLFSAGVMAFSHGSNDAQKTMGIIALSLFSSGLISSLTVPTWVIVLCALTMCLGTMGGGWRIINTMGNKVIKLKPIHGFAAETSSAIVILSASSFGIPVSTTHVISSAIMGVGSMQNLSAVKWGVVGTIVKAWVFTIPVCVLLSFVLYKVIFLLS